MPNAAIFTGGLASRFGGEDQSPLMAGGPIEHPIETSDGGDAVAPNTERGYHPLCAGYSRVCARFVSRRLAEHRLVIHHR